MQSFEKDLNTLYQIQLKYLEKLALKNKPSLPTTNSTSAASAVAPTATSNPTQLFSMQSSKNSSVYLSQSKQIEKLVNHTPIGVLKRSELGQPLRLYYFLSPMDLIKHHTQSQFSSTYNVHQRSLLSVDDLFEHDIGAYCTISLHSFAAPSKTAGDNDNDHHNTSHAELHRLADSSMLILNEQDERTWHDFLNPYLNFNFNFERAPLFSSQTVANGNNKAGLKLTAGGGNSCGGVEVPGCYLLKLNKPVVMCVSTLDELQQRIGCQI